MSKFSSIEASPFIATEQYTKISKRSSGSSVYSLGLMTVGAVNQSVQQAGPSFTHGSDNTFTVTVTTPSNAGDVNVRDFCVRYISEP